MRTAPSSILYQFHSVQNFLSGLIEDLTDKRSLLVLLPDQVDPTEFASALQAEFRRREFEFEKVSLARLSNSRSYAPVTALSNALGIKWPSADTPHTIMNLMETGNLPDFILLEDAGQLSSQECGVWSSFLVRWAEHCQHRVNQRLPITALCLVGPAAGMLCHVPENKVYLVVHWWWGFPSALEMRILCRLTTSVNNWDTMTRWREYVVPALAGNDIFLASNLMELDVLRDVQTINQYLQNFAEQRGWEAENLLTWGLEEEMSFHDTGYSLMPPRSLHTLWAHGVVGWTLEYGLELHTAVLAVLERREELSHRLWRGQSELILPLVDRTRLEICKYLTSFHGPDWPVREYAPESPQEEEIVRKNPLACQLGHLHFVLKNSSFISSKQRLTTPISLCRWIRNQIAHYRPIAFKDFENFLRGVENSVPSKVLSN